MYPHQELFVKKNSARLIELCQDGWMLRLVEVSCKEQGVVELIRDLMLQNMSP